MASAGVPLAVAGTGLNVVGAMMNKHGNDMALDRQNEVMAAEDARQNALRAALEKARGEYITSAQTGGSGNPLNVGGLAEQNQAALDSVGANIMAGSKTGLVTPGMRKRAAMRSRTGALALAKPQAATDFQSGLTDLGLKSDLLGRESKEFTDLLPLGMEEAKQAGQNTRNAASLIGTFGSALTGVGSFL